MADLAARHDLWLIEDNCDALGATCDGRLTGGFGHLATFSFYPAHHLTMGEGGCVVTRDSRLKTLVESFRDWGRACWCAPGADNTCGKRFDWQLGELPAGYDHKYIYSHVGYNLKATDMQAAVGVAQLEKLPDFIAARRRNWQLLRARLRGMGRIPDFAAGHTADGAELVWFSDHGQARRPVFAARSGARIWSRGGSARGNSSAAISRGSRPIGACRFASPATLKTPIWRCAARFGSASIRA